MGGNSIKERSNLELRRNFVTGRTIHQWNCSPPEILGTLRHWRLLRRDWRATRLKWDRVSSFFTETPHDMTARAGEDVEMACSFRGSSSPSYSLEIQWWYVRTHKDWTEKENWDNNNQAANNQRDVVKVAGSNISHKLRLSRVKPADEGTYECRVIDFSDRQARHHKAKAYLRVEAEDSGGGGGGGRPLQETQLLLLAAGQSPPERGRPAAPPPPPPPPPAGGGVPRPPGAGPPPPVLLLLLLLPPPRPELLDRGGGRPLLRPRAATERSPRTC
uniref:V-set and transmembrane domain containing 2 like n=1 Tax=Pseudonaja textilis TaxID=8673 RepID=A0A670ZLB5_PSETE